MAVESAAMRPVEEPTAQRTSGNKSSYGRRYRYFLFVAPAILTTIAVILFPWLYTVYMSLHEWKVGSDRRWVGLQNYINLLSDSRFIDSVWRTFLFTALAVIFPVVLGVAAALIFHQEFPFRGVFRVVFMMPMIATPVAIALVWTMMYHPQLGVLNYLLSRVGLPAQLWIYSPDTVIPALVIVETWQWTPLVMIIVLGGLASLPVEPVESALIDGANTYQIFRHITLPLVMPFIMVAIVLRMIDALKSFDIIFAMTQGGPGTASETINIYLYLQAFSFFRIGHASAVVVVFFAIIVACSLVMLWLRQKTKWS